MATPIPYIRLILILAFSAIAGCSSSEGDTRHGAKANPSAVYQYQIPEKTDDGWQTASLSDHGIDQELIHRMVGRIRSGEYTGISSVLLIRNSNLVLEEYFSNSNRNSLHSMRSASKSVTSALVGIAIDKGFIESVNEPILAYFPEYEGEIDNWDERKRDITIAHVLTMTSGIKGNEDAMYSSSDWIKFYLDQPLVAGPGEQFSYATSGVVSLGSVISRSSGMTIPEFTDQYLFKPLGIEKYRWPITNSRGNQGLAMTGGGLNLRPRDMAKFGQLYLNDGIWKGERLLSGSWIRESTTKHAISNHHGEDFGYLWRMIDRTVADQKIRSIEAWGNGGQFIMVIPSLRLVAVFTGENYGLFPEMEQPFEMMEHYVLPAVMGEKK